MITAYHGSTKRFKEFSLEKIGTGDGRSVGAFGIYFHVLKEMAAEYALKGGAIYTVGIRDGKFLDLDDLTPVHEKARFVAEAICMGISTEDIQEMKETYFEPEDGYDVPDAQNFYDYLSAILGSKQKASVLLARCGYSGAKFTDRGTVASVALRDDKPELLTADDINYVVFDPYDIVITNTEYK